MTMEEADFESALGAWLGRAQAMVREEYARLYPNVAPPMLVMSPGGIRYVRIVSCDAGSESGSAFAFVERATGNVLKPDGWKRPAKGVRGNIWDPDKLGVGGHGAFYAASYRRGGA